MPTIANENLNQIRQPLEVYVNIYQKTGIELTVTQTGAAIADLTTLEIQEYNLMALADLSGDGFPLDGTVNLYDPNYTATAETGKVGIRSDVGGAMSVNISGSIQIPAITLRLKGTGQITANNKTYNARSFIVIPVNATSITLTVTPNAGNRIEIEDITSGVTLELNNDNIISCSLDLESDLSLIDANWAVSSIDVNAYWPEDISDAVAGMGDGVPIVYYSGYSGDYSTPRYFYLSEEVTQKNNIITIHGEDASTLLEKVNINDLLWAQTRQNARQGIYNHMKTVIQQAGIKLAYIEAEPPTIGSNKTVYYVGVNECTARDLIAYIMTMTGKNDFYPRFIDAGIPTLKWAAPTVQYTIYEDDMAEHEIKTERNINVIKSADDETPLETVLSLSNKRSTIETKNVTAGKTYSINYNENRYTDIQIKNKVAEITKQSLTGLTVRALKTTEKIQKLVLTGYKKYEKKYKISDAMVISEPPKIIDGYKTNVKKKKSGNYIIYTWREPILSKRTEYTNQLIITGRRVNIPNAVLPGQPQVTFKEVTANRVGITKETTPLFLGRFLSNYNDSYYYLPEYEDIFNKSNKSGSFKFMGNPKIQPRDVIKIIKLDNTEITATVQSVTLEHEGGGLISVITYREGIL